MQRPADRQLQIAAWSGLVVNVALTLSKAVIGLNADSRALLADAVHSGADVFGSLAVMVGLRVARKPPDADHPYGHGKAELLSSAVVAAVLVLVALQVGYDSIRSLFASVNPPSPPAAWMAAAAIVVKEILYQYFHRLGKRLNSQSLLASAVDHRSDVFASLAALVGIVLAIVGEQTGVRGLLYMDGVAGAVVALLVLKMGYDLARETAQPLMDRVLEGEEMTPYQTCVRRVAGVRRIDELRVRDHGQYVIVDVKIGVDAEITVAHGHAIAADVKQVLMHEFPRVLDVLVHVNPYYAEDAQDPRRDREGRGDG
ncbi:cation diffusion facilitator family transporter [Alicyclobacillus herbarius]|uniref:cation diffusion facilitator family transporter n=1 Tax=Alicyclobacillus herbarius TaxID=122960 RepID=UPI0004146A5E|nr:cation diffusion facilitator family transporter [Alicyclobacillus herbarius]